MATPAYFLTTLDPRVRIRGSRDGIGVQTVWAGMARPLIGNLTTVTSSLRGFITLLTGLRLAEQAGSDPDDAFVVWEQMTAIARLHVHGQRDFAGLRRVRRRIGEATGRRVQVSALPEHQILGNQRTDGLLGNYTAPARVSGLVRPGSPARLTSAGATFVDRVYLPRLAAAWGTNCRNLLRALSGDTVWFDISDNPRLQAIASLFEPVLSAAEHDFFRRQLIEGGPNDTTGGRQERFAGLLEAHLDEGLSQQLFAALQANAESQGWSDVAEHLRRIAACESVLAPATGLFGFVLGQHGRPVGEVAGIVREQWGDRLPGVHPGTWPDVSDALAAGDYRTAIEALVRRNQQVTVSRGGSLPWVQITDRDELYVRNTGEAAGLPDSDIWIHPYFVPSLRSVLLALREGRT